MSYRSLALVAAVAALSSMDVTSAAAQSAYVAPGGIYVGAGTGPVHVTNGGHDFGPVAYAGPGYDYGYGVAAYREPGYDCGYGVAAYEEPGYGCGCEPGPYVAPRYGYGQGPAPAPYGPVPRGYGYEPPPAPPYGYGAVPRGNAYGPPPAPPYGGYGYGPERDYGYGPPPRHRRPARTASRPLNADAAELSGRPHAPAPFAGQR
jgi:hypothetical protein